MILCCLVKHFFCFKRTLTSLSVNVVIYDRMSGVETLNLNKTVLNDDFVIHICSYSELSLKFSNNIFLHCEKTLIETAVRS